jgi:hypothetical protein
MHTYNWYHSNVTGIHYVHKHRLQYTWRIPLAFLFPLADSLLSPFYPLLLTWNPPSCDRIRPPRSQVACKLTPPSQSFPNPPPSKFPEPRLPSAPLRRPQEESGVFCPEHLCTKNMLWTSNYMKVLFNRLTIITITKWYNKDFRKSAILLSKN